MAEALPSDRIFSLFCFGQPKTSVSIFLVCLRTAQTNPTDSTFGSGVLRSATPLSWQRDGAGTSNYVKLQWIFFLGFLLLAYNCGRWVRSWARLMLASPSALLAVAFVVMDLSESFACEVTKPSIVAHESVHTRRIIIQLSGQYVWITHNYWVRCYG